MEWNTLLVAFSMVFLAEFGDKTQLAVLALATQRHPWSVLLGAGLALVLSTVLATVLAVLIAGYLPPYTVRVTRWASGVLFILVGVWTLIRPV